MPYISIIVPMMRPGGLDIIFSGLENQTFKDFELIIVDNLYKYRKDIIKEKAKEYTFQYKHIPPMVDKFPIHSPSSTFNTGVINASGEVILPTIDYRYFMPWTLQKHADFHKNNPDNHGYAPPTKFVIPKHLKSGLPSYERDYKTYVNDLENNKLQQYMWSINEKEFTKNSEDPSGWQEIDISHGYDPKTNINPGSQVSPMLFFLQAESIKTKLILEANGFDESLDGATNYQDIELSHRLRNLFDFKFYGDNTNTTYRVVVGGHSIIKKLQLIDSVCNKAESIFRKVEAGSCDKVNNWNIKETRSKILNGNI